MLVLARKSRESVVVGKPSGAEPLLKVTVLEIRSGLVKLGFEAEADVPVHRAELWERIRAEDETPESAPTDYAPTHPAPYIE
jgi:carbon storage regulator